MVQPSPSEGLLGAHSLRSDQQNTQQGEQPPRGREAAGFMGASGAHSARQQSVGVSWGEAVQLGAEFAKDAVFLPPAGMT